ncbi:phosphate ABC transporter permease subunit PstC [Janibacter sp. G349]|uniref:phosphate ABC transporter permease subunit PstC n=1 Tax=unclassified Janibacter TaxID=2649294 RepID=UPI003B7D970F
MSVTSTVAPARKGGDNVSLEATSSRWGEKAVVAWLFLCGALSVLVTVGIVVSLVGPAVEFFRAVSPGQFFSTDDWAPRQDLFGVSRLVAGTAAVVLYSCIVALPAGLGAAIFLNEYAKPRTRRILKPLLEVLEGVPTVAYGFFAFVFVTPLIREWWPTFLPGKLGEAPGIFSVGAAGLVLGIMIIPTVASISQDAMAAVPKGLREAAYGLGSTRRQVATEVVVPAALSGIIASFVLGVSRAVGETMVVLMAAGATARLGLWPNEEALPMTAFIARTSTGDIATGTTIYYTVFAVGSLLFLITFTMNYFSARLVRRFREAYE